jgi:hypothetical protein
MFEAGIVPVRPSVASTVPLDKILLANPLVIAPIFYLLNW